MPRLPRHTALLGALALLPACGTPAGEVYPLALVDARQRVFATEVPMFVFGDAGGMLLDVQPLAGTDTVSWPITTKGRELFRYVATITPVDAAHTRVDVALVPAPGTDPASVKVAEGIKANPDIAGLYRAAMVEAVDAQLEHRDFAVAAITPAMTIAAIGRFKDIDAGFERESARHGKQVKSNLERAYAAEGVEY